MAKKKAADKNKNEEIKETTAQEVQEKKKNKPKNEEVDDQKAEEEKEKKEEVDQEEEPSPEEQVNEYKDKYIRLSAEFDNYRKRTLKEKIELTKTASEEIIKKLLPIVDDFERGLSHMEEVKDVKAVKDGVVLIYNKLGDILKQQGVKEIEAKEKAFDMDIHEAVTKIPAPKEELKGKVVDVVEKGYYLNEKIIRYPKVVVGE